MKHKYAACCYCCSLVCLFMYLRVWCVCLCLRNREPCKNGWTDQGVVWGMDSGDGSKEVLCDGPDPPPRPMGQFVGIFQPVSIRTRPTATWHTHTHRRTWPTATTGSMGISRIGQCCLIGGSSDAAFPCHFCNNLFLVTFICAAAAVNIGKIFDTC